MVRRVLCLGDSLTAGLWSGGLDPYGSHMEVDADVTSLGMSGWTAARMLADADHPVWIDGLGRPVEGLGAALKRAPYDLVVVMAGTNDLPEAAASSARANQLVDDIWGLHRLCHDAGCPTIALGIPGSGWQAATPRARVVRDHVNRELLQRCRGSGRAAQYLEFPIRYGAPGMWEPDGLHLSPTGSGMLGTLVAPHVAAALQRVPKQ